MNDIEVQSKFIAELNNLLKKYKVTMSIEYADRGDPEDRINFWAYAQYDENHNLIAEHIDYRTKEMGW